jgi:hypothetical protein
MINLSFQNRKKGKRKKKLQVLGLNAPSEASGLVKLAHPLSRVASALPFMEQSRIWRVMPLLKQTRVATLTPSIRGKEQQPIQSAALAF